MDQGIEVVGELGADARLLEVAVGVGDLAVDEVARFGALGVFKPAVGVSDSGAEVVVGYGDGFRGWGWWEGDVISAVDGLRGGGGLGVGGGG